MRRLRPWIRLPTSHVRRAVMYGFNTVGEMTNTSASGEGLSRFAVNNTIPHKQMLFHKYLLNTLHILIQQSLFFAATEKATEQHKDTKFCRLSL